MKSCDSCPLSKILPKQFQFVNWVVCPPEYLVVVSHCPGSLEQSPCLAFVTIVICTRSPLLTFSPRFSSLISPLHTICITESSVNLLPNSSWYSRYNYITFTTTLQDRSDDEESDHNTSDTYPSQMRGRVSPSPYTANTERARQFNVSW